MKRKIIFCFLSLIIFIGVSNVFATSCGSGTNFSDPSSISIGSALQNCVPDGAITTTTTNSSIAGGTISLSSNPGDYTIENGVKNRIENLTYQIIIIGWVLAVGAIVLSAVFYVIALGDEKKITDAKNALQYSIIGFMCILIAYPLVNAIINLIFNIVWWK